MATAMEKAKRLMAKMKQSKLVNAFVAWRNFMEFERSIQQAQEVIEPYLSILDDLPQNRTQRDIKKLAGLLQTVRAYKDFFPPVLELLATYCTLLMVWDSVELPRTAEEANCVYSVVAGGMDGVSADPGDPVLRMTVVMAAEQVLESYGRDDNSSIAQEDSLGGRSSLLGSTPVTPPLSTTPTMGGPARTGNTGGTGTAAQPAAASKAGASPVNSVGDVTVAPHSPLLSGAAASTTGGSSTGTAARMLKHHDTFQTYGLGEKYATRTITSRLWHTVVEIARQQRVPHRREAEQWAAAQERSRSRAAASTSPLLHTVLSGSTLQTKGSNSTVFQGFNPQGSSHHGEQSPLAREMGRQQSITSDRSASTNRAKESGGTPGHGSSAFTGVTILDLGVGESFSGRELDCRIEAALSAEQQHLEFPPKALAAVSKTNIMTALLVISKPVYKRALRMQQNMLLLQSVNACCRLPFLRHTPLKELYRLAKYLNEVKYSQGDIILHQGKEVQNVMFLVEGEVEIVLDLPYTQDKAILEAALQRAMTDDQRIAAAAAAAAGRATLQGQSTMLRASGVRSPDLRPPEWQGPKQRVVLARRTPGAILGDDALRERRLAVSVVAASPRTIVLAVSSQRFSMCVDALTLRLFNKLRAQEGCMSEFSAAVADSAGRDALLARCRHALIAASRDSPIPATIAKDQQGKSGQQDKKRPWVPTSAQNDSFGEPPSMYWVERRMDEVATVEALQEARITTHRLHGASQVALTREQQVIARQQRRANGRVTPEDSMALLPALPKGISITWLAGMNMTESLAKLADMIRQVEGKRASDAVAQRQRTSSLSGAHDELIKAEPSIVTKLDLTNSLVAAATNRVHTEMMEACCLAVVQVVQLPGQSSVPAEVLAPVLDDAAVAWSMLVHDARVMLVRWTSTEYFLISQLDPSQNKRPVVRTLADTLLQMRDVFARTIAHNPIPHFAFAAGIVIGGLFTTYDTGRFLTAMSGQAYGAASALCAEALAVNPLGCILVSDAVMQAISRTHVLQFTGAGYELMGAVSLPFDATFDELYGRGTVEQEPVAPGLSKSAYQSKLKAEAESAQREEEARLQAASTALSAPNSMVSLPRPQEPITNGPGSSQGTRSGGGILKASAAPTAPPPPAGAAQPAQGGDGEPLGGVAAEESSGGGLASEPSSPTATAALARDVLLSQARERQARAASRLAGQITGSSSPTPKTSHKISSIHSSHFVESGEIISLAGQWGTVPRFPAGPPVSNLTPSGMSVTMQGTTGSNFGTAGMRGTAPFARQGPRSGAVSPDPRRPDGGLASAGPSITSPHPLGGGGTTRGGHVLQGPHPSVPEHADLKEAARGIVQRQMVAHGRAVGARSIDVYQKLTVDVSADHHHHHHHTQSTPGTHSVGTSPGMHTSTSASGAQAHWSHKHGASPGAAVQGGFSPATAAASGVMPAPAGQLNPSGGSFGGPMPPYGVGNPPPIITTPAGSSFLTASPGSQTFGQGGSPTARAQQAGQQSLSPQRGPPGNPWGGVAGGAAQPDSPSFAAHMFAMVALPPAMPPPKALAPTHPLSTKLSNKKEAISGTTKMAIRQQLRAEMRALQPSYPDPTDLSRIPHSSFTPSWQKAPPRGMGPLGATHVASLTASLATAHLGPSISPAGSPTRAAAGAAAADAQHATIAYGSPQAAAGQVAGLYATAQFGFRSKNSTEATAAISVGAASGKPSPHQPVVSSMTPYGPGTGPLASLSARHRSADVLFAGAAAQAAVQGTVIPIAPPRLAHAHTSFTSTGPWAASISSDAGAAAAFGVQDFSGQLIALPSVEGPPGSAGTVTGFSNRTPTGSAGGVGFSAIPEGEVVSGGGVVNGGVTVTARAGNTKAGALNALAEGQLARDALGATVSALQGLPTRGHMDPGAVALGATVATMSAAANSPATTGLLLSADQPYTTDAALYATGNSSGSGEAVVPSVSTVARAKGAVGHAAAAAVASVAAAVKSLAPSVQGTIAVLPIHVASPSMQMVAGGTASSGTSPRLKYDSTPVRPRAGSPPKVPGTDLADASQQGPTVLLDLAQQYSPPVVLQPSPRQPPGYVPSNLGYIPTALLQQAQPQQTAGGQQGDGTAFQQGAFAALQGEPFSSTGGRGRSRSPGAGTKRNRSASPPGSPGAAGSGSNPGGLYGNLEPPGTAASAYQAALAKSRARTIDGVTGMSQAQIHRQAVTTWKDLGSKRAAEEYVAHLPVGLINISFSTAGLTSLPNLKRLAHLESLAASYNMLCGPISEAVIAGLGSNLKSLSLTHCSITELPYNFGYLLPSLLELNLAWNDLPLLPGSICTIPKLRCLSVEHNKLEVLPSRFWQMYSLVQLWLGHNCLPSLPDTFGSLTSLALLHVEANQLKELPFSLLKLGPSLTSLNAAHNQLSSLPPGLLRSLTRLSRLDLQFNRLCSCPQIHGPRSAVVQYSEELEFSDEDRESVTGGALSRANSEHSLFLKGEGAQVTPGSGSRAGSPAQPHRLHAVSDSEDIGSRLSSRQSMKKKSASFRIRGMSGDEGEEMLVLPGESSASALPGAEGSGGGAGSRSFKRPDSRPGSMRGQREGSMGVTLRAPATQPLSTPSAHMGSGPVYLRIASRTLLLSEDSSRSMSASFSRPGSGRLLSAGALGSTLDGTTRPSSAAVQMQGSDPLGSPLPSHNSGSSGRLGSVGSDGIRKSRSFSAGAVQPGVMSGPVPGGSGRLGSAGSNSIRRLSPPSRLASASSRLAPRGASPTRTSDGDQGGTSVVQRDAVYQVAPGGGSEGAFVAPGGAGSGTVGDSSSVGGFSGAAAATAPGAAGTGTQDIPLPPLAGIKEEVSQATSAGAELVRASRESLGPEPTAALLGTPFADQQQPSILQPPQAEPATSDAQQKVASPSASAVKAGTPQVSTGSKLVEAISQSGRDGRASNSGGITLTASGQRAGSPLSRSRLETPPINLTPPNAELVPAPLSGSPVSPDAAALINDGIQLLPASSSMRRSALLSSSPTQGGRAIMKQATFSPPRPTPQQVAQAEDSSYFVYAEDGSCPAALPSLTTINLSGNQLRAVPGWLPPSLTSCDLSKNQIEALPVWTCQRLSGLRLLSLHANRLDSVPRELGGCCHLYCLSLEDNPVMDPLRAHGPTGAGWAVDAILKAKLQSKLESTIGSGARITGGLPTTLTPTSAGRGGGGSLAGGPEQSMDSLMTGTGGAWPNNASVASLSGGPPHTLPPLASPTGAAAMAAAGAHQSPRTPAAAVAANTPPGRRSLTGAGTSTLSLSGGMGR